MTQEERHELDSMKQNGGYPTRNKDLMRLTLPQLAELRNSAERDSDLCGDRSYARTLRQLATRIRDIITVKSEAAISTFIDPFGIIKVA